MNLIHWLLLGAAGLFVVILVIFVWALLKAASDADDWYDEHWPRG